MATPTPPLGLHAGSKAKAVVDTLQSMFPLELAEGWDNVGVLIDSVATEGDGCKVFLTNDLTELVLDEAIAVGATFVVTYHPTPFSKVKKLSFANVPDRIMLKAIRAGLCVYSPHTACDNAVGGVNDWLIQGLGMPGTIVPVTPIATHAGAGQGRSLTLEAPTTLAAVVAATKAHVGLTHLRVAVAFKHRAAGETVAQQMDAAVVESVACQAGSGAHTLQGCGADVYLSGEMSHHEMLAANAAGASVILTEHSNSERGFLSGWLKGKLEAAVPGVEVIVSTVDVDPVAIV